MPSINHPNDDANEIGKAIQEDQRNKEYEKEILPAAPTPEEIARKERSRFFEEGDHLPDGTVLPMVKPSGMLQWLRETANKVLGIPPGRSTIEELFDAIALRELRETKREGFIEIGTDESLGRDLRRVVISVNLQVPAIDGDWLQVRLDGGELDEALLCLLRDVQIDAAALVSRAFEVKAQPMGDHSE